MHRGTLMRGAGSKTSEFRGLKGKGRGQEGSSRLIGASHGTPRAGEPGAILGSTREACLLIRVAQAGIHCLCPWLCKTQIESSWGERLQCGSPKSTSFHIQAHLVQVLVFSPLIAPVVFSFLFLSLPPAPFCWSVSLLLFHFLCLFPSFSLT